MFGDFSGNQTHYVYPNGNEVSNIDIVYLCKSYTGKLRCQETELEELRFFPPDNLPEIFPHPFVFPYFVGPIANGNNRNFIPSRPPVLETGGRLLYNNINSFMRGM